MSKGYHVMWEIDIDSAESPQDAARQALDIILREGSVANVFDVTEEDGTDTVRVDLEDDKCQFCGEPCAYCMPAPE